MEDCELGKSLQRFLPEHPSILFSVMTAFYPQGKLEEATFCT